jgi:hypothetical protein
MDLSVSSSERLIIGEVFALTGNITSSIMVWWEDRREFAPGWYQIRYKNGAFRFGKQFGWGVSSNWRVLTNRGSEIELFHAPSVPSPIGKSLPNGLYGGHGWDNQALVEAANQGQFINFYHDGGPLGLRLLDNPYTDNIHGSPDPTWELCTLVPEIVPPPVEPGSEPGSEPSSDGSTPGSEPGSQPPPCVKETPQIGLLPAKYKALLDTLPEKPGGFGFVFHPGVHLTNDKNADSILTGNVEIVSSSLAISCQNVADQNQSRRVITLGVSDDFLNSFCLEVKGPKGQKGEKGPKGKDGRHGVGDGPAGLPGPNGVDATERHVFSGIKVVESDEVHDTAVVNLSLDPQAGVLDVVKAKIAVPDSTLPASRVMASPIFRDVEFFGDSDLTKWQLVAPGDDPAGVIDISIVKLPAGWSGETGPQNKERGSVPVATMKLSDLVTQIVNFYIERAGDITARWDQQMRDYVAGKDKQARDILASLAKELADCEWQKPIDFCAAIVPANCDAGEEPGSGSGSAGELPEVSDDDGIFVPIVTKVTRK